MLTLGLRHWHRSLIYTALLYAEPYESRSVVVPVMVRQVLQSGTRIGSFVSL